MLSVLEKQLTDKIQLHLKDVTPGVMIRAYHTGRQVLDLSIGETFPYYDLASLTKVVFSVQAAMLAAEKNLWNFDTKIIDILRWFPDQHLKISELLTHSAGFEGWFPFYQHINLQLNLPERRKELADILSRLPRKKGNVSVYSDPGMILFGFVLEELFQKSLVDIWIDLKNEFYDGTTFEFHENNKAVYDSKLYAPTEECSWRRRLLQGEVHDENAWSFGGVSTHAGLFGSLDDMGWYMLQLRGIFFGIGRSQIKMKNIKQFLKRARPEGQGDWAMGFMLPSPGVSSSGDYLNVDSVGHTGFTGTSIWFDPKQDLAISILSNRVLFGRNNDRFKQLRPQIHNWIVEGLKKSSY